MPAPPLQGFYAPCLQNARNLVMSFLPAVLALILGSFFVLKAWSGRCLEVLCRLCVKLEAQLRGLKNRRLCPGAWLAAAACPLDSWGKKRRQCAQSTLTWA